MWIINHGQIALTNFYPVHARCFQNDVFIYISVWVKTTGEYSVRGGKLER